MNVTAEQKRVAKLLGIKNIDSQNDLNKIKRALEGAKAVGIKTLDSANDLRKIEEYYSKNSNAATPASNSNAAPPASNSNAAAVNERESYYQQMLENFKIQYSQQESRFQDQLKIQSAQQEAGFKNRLKIMQDSFDTAQRTTLGNQARGTQKADYRLNSASQSRLSGSYGFRRSGGGASTPFSAIGFTAPNAVQNKSRTLNV